MNPDWRKIVFQLPGNEIDQISINTSVYGDEDIQFRLSGLGAQHFLDQARGGGTSVLPSPVTPVNHQDEALASARRDAEHAKSRASTAEARVAVLEEELRDYQGEIDALHEDLEELEELRAEKAARNEAKRQSFKRLYNMSPTNPLATGGYTGTPAAGTSVHDSLPAIDHTIAYSQKDAEMTQKMINQLLERSKFDAEKYTLEGGL